MIPPKSSKSYISEDPAGVLRRSRKDLSKMKPLHLRGEITTWQYDAKNCAIIYYRIKSCTIFSPDLVKAVKDWAERLLFYAAIMEFPVIFPCYIVNGLPSIHQGYWWLIEILTEITEYQRPDVLYKLYAKETAYWPMLYSSLTHVPFKIPDSTITYYFQDDKGRSHYGGTLLKGELKHVTQKIKKALKRHRNPDYRAKIILKMKEKQYDKQKRRIGI